MKAESGFSLFSSLTIFLATLGLGLLLTEKVGSAKPEYTRKTKLACERCHPPDSRQLNEAGEYYRTHGYKMDGYKPSEDQGKPTKAKQAQNK